MTADTKKLDDNLLKPPSEKVTHPAEVEQEDTPGNRLKATEQRADTDSVAGAYADEDSEKPREKAA